MLRQVRFHYERSFYETSLPEKEVRAIQRGSVISVVLGGLKGRFKVDYVSPIFPPEIGLRYLGEIPTSCSMAYTARSV